LEIDNNIILLKDSFTTIFGIAKGFLVNKTTQNKYYTLMIKIDDIYNIETMTNIKYKTGKQCVPIFNIIKINNYDVDILNYYILDAYTGYQIKIFKLSNVGLNTKYIYTFSHKNTKKCDFVYNEYELLVVEDFNLAYFKDKIKKYFNHKNEIDIENLQNTLDRIVLL
jgi:hypothetical protein